FELHPGDVLALFSDGVTEAHDEGENEFGEERLSEFLRPIRNEPAETLVDKIFCEIDGFAGSAPQYDDISLFIIRRAMWLSIAPQPPRVSGRHSLRLERLFEK